MDIRIRKRPINIKIVQTVSLFTIVFHTHQLAASNFENQRPAVQVQIWQLETANADVEESQPCRTFSTLPFSQLARRRFKARRGAGGGAAWLDFIQGEMQLGLIPSCSDLDVIVR